MNTEEELKRRISRLFRPHSAHIAYPVIAAIIASVVAVIVHDRSRHALIPKAELHYNARRMVHIMAFCKGHARDQTWQAVEARIGKSLKDWTAQDNLSAIDYLLDRLEANACIKEGEAKLPPN